MTSRPRRRNEQPGLELSEERAEEYFRLIGTPAQELDKSKELGEYIPPWKQEVRDEKGRRRLHGAFTGGFSAGYYNTVGSKEGWAPKAFVSSRSERAARKVARPEDFMDEEDIAALMEEQDELEKEEEEKAIAAAREEFRHGGHGQPDFVSSAQEAVLSGSSLGARLLQKMGKLSEPSTAQFAPPETSQSLPSTQQFKKAEARGLGYIPDKTQATKSKSVIQGPRLAVGFGLGALNDAEDDDLDIYEGPTQDASKTRLAYDSAHPEQAEGKGKTTTGNRPLAGFVPADQPPTNPDSSYRDADDTTNRQTPSLPPTQALVPHSTPTLPFTEPHIAQAAIQGFQPFSTDPAKHVRYHTYLHSQAFSGTAPPLRPRHDQHPDEFRKEVESYAKAAQLFKPMSGAMANRFTSGGAVGSIGHMQSSSEGLHRPSAAGSMPPPPPPTTTTTKPVVEKEESPKAQAARLGMYGPLTRETKVWMPARLLCKRFGVKDPNPEPEASSTTPSGSKMNSNVTPNPSGPGPATTTTKVSTTPSKPSATPLGQNANGKELRDVVMQPAQAPPPTPQQQQQQQQPQSTSSAVDIYNTIFAGGDEDDASEDETENNTKPTTNDSAPRPPAPPASPEKFDLSTFKPTFVPRSDKDKDKSSSSSSRKRDKKDKKKHQKKKGGAGAGGAGGGKVLVSFEVDGESGGGAAAAHAHAFERPKKKRKLDHEGDQGAHGGVVPPVAPAEPVVETIKFAPPPPVPPPIADVPPIAAASPRGRKRAIDFM